jgi:diguanylate cyclase (GGDEF)-like protein
MCFAWQRNVLLLHVVSDGLIALAYFSIPLTLAIFAAKRRDLPFKPLFAMFGTFIVACGMTHVLAIWTIWHPDYWLDGWVKAFTAGISIVTAIALVGLVPKALALRSPRELEKLNGCLEAASFETQATIENLGDGVLVLDAELRTLRVNKSAKRLLAIQAACDHKAVDADGGYVPPGRWPATTVRSTAQPQSAVMGFGCDGDRRWIAVYATPLRLPGSSAELDRIIVSMRDVTDMKEREEKQREYARQLRSLHLIASMTTGHRKEQIDAALLVGLQPLGLERAFLGKIDNETNELVIESSVAIDGCTSDSIAVGARYPLQQTFIGPAIDNRDALTVLDLAAEREVSGHSHYGGTGSYIAVPIFVDGVAYGAIGFIASAPRKSPFAPETIEFVKLAGDLIASALVRAAQNERLDSLAFFDALTGLPNRVLLYDRLVQTILASQRRAERFAVLFLDLDGFKAVNDRFGHAAGDVVLKVVATRLTETLRESDTVARLGGDEFVVIGAGIATLHDAHTFADRIMTAIQEPIMDGDQTYRLSASIGVSFYPMDGTEMNALIERADIALYTAKHSGKNRVEFFSQEPALDPVA